MLFKYQATTNQALPFRGFKTATARKCNRKWGLQVLKCIAGLYHSSVFWCRLKPALSRQKKQFSRLFGWGLVVQLFPDFLCPKIMADLRYTKRMAGLQEIQFMVGDWSTELPIQSWPKDCQPLKKLWRYWLIRGYHISQIGDDRQSYWWSMVISPSQSSHKYGAKISILLGEAHGFAWSQSWFRSSIGFGHSSRLGALGAAVVSAAFGEAHTHICTFLPLVVQPIDDGSLDDPWPARFSCEFGGQSSRWVQLGVHGRGLYHPTFCAAWPVYGLQPSPVYQGYSRPSFS